VASLRRDDREETRLGIASERGDQPIATPERVSSLKRPGERSALIELASWLSRSLAILAVLSSAALILVGLTPQLTALIGAIAAAAPRVLSMVRSLPFSSVPLLTAGLAYILLQLVARPGPLELLKRLMLGAAFLLWGIVQMMPAGHLSNELGNVVIALYVVDLALIIRTDLQRA
jgi:hypothetical protein